MKEKKKPLITNKSQTQIINKIEIRLWISEYCDKNKLQVERSRDKKNNYSPKRETHSLQNNINIILTRFDIWIRSEKIKRETELKPSVKIICCSIVPNANNIASRFNLRWNPNTINERLTANQPRCIRTSKSYVALGKLMYLSANRTKIIYRDTTESYFSKSQLE